MSLSNLKKMRHPLKRLFFKTPKYFKIIQFPLTNNCLPFICIIYKTIKFYFKINQLEIIEWPKAIQKKFNTKQPINLHITKIVYKNYIYYLQ